MKKAILFATFFCFSFLTATGQSDAEIWYQLQKAKEDNRSVLVEIGYHYFTQLIFLPREENFIVFFLVQKKKKTYKVQFVATPTQIINITKNPTPGDNKSNQKKIPKKYRKLICQLAGNYW